MSQKLDELKEAASALDVAEREQLVQFLLATLASAPTIDWRQQLVETDESRQHLADAIAAYKASLKSPEPAAASTTDSGEWEQILDELEK